MQGAKMKGGDGVPPSGIKRPGRDVDHQPASSAEVKNECATVSQEKRISFMIRLLAS